MRNEFVLQLRWISGSPYGFICQRTDHSDVSTFVDPKFFGLSFWSTILGLILIGTGIVLAEIGFRPIRSLLLLSPTLVPLTIAAYRLIRIVFRRKILVIDWRNRQVRVSENWPRQYSTAEPLQSCQLEICNLQIYSGSYSWYGYCLWLHVGGQFFVLAQAKSVVELRQAMNTLQLHGITVVESDRDIIARIPI